MLYESFCFNVSVLLSVVAGAIYLLAYVKLKQGFFSV